MTIERGIPDAELYARLRRAVGWGGPDPNRAAAGLAASRGGVLALEAGRVVGMGRLVGDGAIYLLAVDVIVEPAFQGQGVGRLLVAELGAIAAELAPASRLLLIAAPDVLPFYRRLGFEPTGSTVLSPAS